jgi:hypothetical protein
MKVTGVLLIGLIVGFLFGYWLHASLRPPLGSARGEERVLKQDLDLTQSYAFAPGRPFVSGLVRKGSHFTVAFRKSREVMYVSFETALSEETIKQASSAYAERRKSSPN